MSAVRAAGISSFWQSQRDRRHILTFEFSFPPAAGFSALGDVSEMILIDRCADEFRGIIGKRILIEQRQDVGRTLQQAETEVLKPRI